MRFSLSEAAFEGFRVIRSHPGVLFGWGLIWLISLIATVLTAMPILQPVMGELQAMLQSMASGAAVEPSLAIQNRMTYATWATLPISLVTQAVLLPALYRAMTAETRDRFAFLRLGRDELRVLGVLTLLALISLTLSQAGEFALLMSAGTGMEAGGGLVSVLATVLSVFLSVRLVMAAPQTYVTGRIDLRRAWTLTQGLFWPLLGLAVMAGAMACVVALLLFVISLPISGLVTGAVGGSAVAAGAAAGLLIIMAIGASMVLTTVAAPFMAAYRRTSTETARLEG
jgi:hypothetical protein